MDKKEITLSKTYNLGNYESLRVELKAEIDPDDNVQSCLSSLEKEADKYRESRER